MKYKSTKAALYTTVALSTIFINAFVANDAIAAPVTYGGTNREYEELPVDKILAPPINGSQSGNTIEVSDSTPVGETFKAPNGIRGGYSSVASVENNHVKILNGTIAGDVYGGYGYATRSVANNSVEISTGTIGGNVYGGHSTGFGTRNVTDNHVVISAGTIVANVYGGSGIGANFVKKNSVNISDGTINGSVYGGYSSGLGAFLVTENEVIISAGAIDGDVYGGRGTPFDGGILNVTDNRVYISGGAITGVVYGGSGAFTVNNNSVVISGGIIEGSVYGGYAFGDGSVTAINNTVTLKNNAVVHGSVYGGYAALSPLNDVVNEFNAVVSGNTLNLNEYHSSVAGIYNFENYNWLLPSNVANGDVLIHIDGNNDVNLNRTNHTFNMINDGTFLRAGDKIILIDKATGSPNEVPTQVEQMQQGLLIVYDVDIGVDGDGNFVLKVADEAEITPRAKAFLEGRAAALGLGANADASLGLGAGVNVLIGGSNKSFTLQPISVDTEKGIAISAGVETMTLEFNQ